MKKKLTSFILVLCSIIVCSVCGCGADYTEQIEDYKTRIEKLESANGSLQNALEDYKNRIDALESDNSSLQDKIESLESDKPNVFWTDKEEFAQTETMIVYYGNRVAFEIKLPEKKPYILRASGSVYGGAYITSLLFDIPCDSVLLSSYLEYDGKIALNNYSAGTVVCRKGISAYDNTLYKCKLSDDVIEAKEVKIVICVPGTSLPMAYFKISQIYEPEL